MYTLVYRIEVQDRIVVQGGIALQLYTVKLIKLHSKIYFLLHKNQLKGGNFSSKLKSVPACLFGTLEYTFEKVSHYA